METMEIQSWIIVAALMAVILVALGSLVYLRRKKSHKLQERFGPEYDRTVSELGSRTKGESELKAREKRVDRLDSFLWRRRKPPDSLTLGTRYRADSLITPREWSSKPNSWSVS